MDIKPTEEDVRRLEQELTENPNDTDIMNSLAIGYLNNPSLVKDKEDLKLVERAYRTKKTIKSTHNLAWFYDSECWGTLEKAIQIQQECISMNPKSFYPYFQYGHMLLRNKQYLEAIKNLEIAYLKQKSREIAHNLGTAYAMQGDFNSAKNYLIKAANQGDIENNSKYNLAIVKIKLEEKEEALKIVESLKQIIVDGSSRFDNIDVFELAYLYYLSNDEDKAYDCCNLCNWNQYGIFSWQHVPYLIYKKDIEKYHQLVNSEIEERKTWVKEINQNHQSWDDYNEAEKQERLIELKSEINQLNNLEIEFAADKPNIDINNQYFLESYGCLLFGCSFHGNLENDA
ncbi:MAG: hypothetical protein MJK14_10630 [Rivularia sp. ALOHA_DT_140]|nr:hypothetical protein [Rivularia sp. ALOHA_DT_140]